MTHAPRDPDGPHDDDRLRVLLADPDVWPAPLPPERLRRVAERTLVHHLREREARRARLAPRELLVPAVAVLAVVGAAVWGAVSALGGSSPEPGQGSFPSLPVARLTGWLDAVGAWLTEALAAVRSAPPALDPGTLLAWTLAAAAVLWALLPPLAPPSGAERE